MNATTLNNIMLQVNSDSFCAYATVYDHVNRSVRCIIHRNVSQSVRDILYTRLRVKVTESIRMFHCGQVPPALFS